MAEALFWSSFIYITYVYMGYPLLLVAWRRLARRPVHKRYQEPSVSLVIAMHNERLHVERRMRNVRELDYPADKLRVIVSLDGPTDGTDTLVRDYAAAGVEVVHSPVRQGKAAALNSAVARAQGELVLFADARQQFERNAVRELAANFADDSVGAVSGELILLDAQAREASDGVGAYWRYEKQVRVLESDIHSVVGATGAIYAIRRDLFRLLPPDTILDDVAIPMRIVLEGKRVIFDPAARAYDVVSETPEVEYRRKTRTLSGNYQLFAQMPELLAPWRNPVCLQLLSHKLGRLLVPYCLVVLLASNLFLLDGFYLVLFASQVVWYTLAAAGWLASNLAPVRGRYERETP